MKTISIMLGLAITLFSFLVLAVSIYNLVCGGMMSLDNKAISRSSYLTSLELFDSHYYNPPNEMKFDKDMDWVRDALIAKYHNAKQNTRHFGAAGTDRKMDLNASNVQLKKDIESERIALKDLRSGSICLIVITLILIGIGIIMVLFGIRSKKTTGHTASEEAAAASVVASVSVASSEETMIENAKLPARLASTEKRNQLIRTCCYIGGGSYFLLSIILKDGVPGGFIGGMLGIVLGGAFGHIILWFRKDDNIEQIVAEEVEDVRQYDSEILPDDPAFCKKCGKTDSYVDATYQRYCPNCKRYITN